MSIAPFGTWPSPITASRLVTGAAGVGEIRADGVDVWWSEQRPDEQGRTQLVRCQPDGSRQDLFAPLGSDGVTEWNARTALLEYGGGAWGVRDGTVVFANWSDQRLYRAAAGADADVGPVPLTPIPTIARGLRWSEPVWLDDRWLLCVRESHEPDTDTESGSGSERDEPANELVAIPLDGSAVDNPDLIRVLVSGPDFVHSPALRGDEAAWLQWDHPRMPWDGCELMAATVIRDDDGSPVGVTAPDLVAGGPAESVVQPGYLHDGDLVFCTDRTGWWNPWVRPADGGPARPLLAAAGVEAEIGGGLWVGGLRWWAEVAPGRLAVAMTADGADGLGWVEPDGTLRRIDSPLSEVSQVVKGTEPGTALVVGASPTTEGAPYRLGADGSLKVLRPARDLGVEAEWFSQPSHLTFVSAGARVAHALHYPPTNPNVKGPQGELPPLVVMIHGGPTSAARNRLDLGKQFWTSRGFAVVDVNYGGSTGYGRPYRELLNGQWGVVDVEDAVAAASYLVAEGLVDGERLAIRGGSAGGYTTLAALCFHDVFKAGASHYGVADLGALAEDTHKFESRYLDGLVGAWPDERARYEERSPIFHTDGFSAPLIVLQGSEDEVVPPNQAEMIVDALADKAIAHAYVLFEGEQHGFRQAANIVRALEAELWFYGRVFDFDPADAIEPVAGAVGLNS